MSIHNGNFEKVPLEDIKEGAILFRVTGNGPTKPGNVKAVRVTGPIIDHETKRDRMQRSDNPTITVNVEELKEPKSDLGSPYPLNGEMILNRFGYDPAEDDFKTAFRFFQTQEEAEAYAKSEEYRNNFEAYTQERPKVGSVQKNNFKDLGEKMAEFSQSNDGFSSSESSTPKKLSLQEMMAADHRGSNESFAAKLRERVLGPQGQGSPGDFKGP